MKKAYIIVAAAIILVAGCQKEKTFNGMELVAEGFGSCTKAAVNGNNSYWVAGESVRINNETKTVQINGNSAYVSDVTDASQYRALYPVSLNSSYDGTSSSVTVTIPSVYEWAVDGSGRQILDVPMAAYGTNGDRLVFKHLTAAITVEITNHYGFAVQVDNVNISSSSDGTQYQLCGIKEISLTSSNICVDANTSNTNNTVLVNFNDHELKINQGGTARVQVPVLPVGVGNKFSISITVHKDGNTAVSKTFTKTQTTGGAMARAKMAYAGDTVGFTFSVSNSQKIIFSQGNLQWSGTYGWRFALQQYDYIGNAANNNSPTTSDGNFIDLFCWGATGVNGVPPNTEKNYYGGGDDLSGDNDWGACYITNGGGSYQWRTLSQIEWDNLFNNRSKYGYAIVNNTNGVIILPDGFIDPMKNNGSGAFVNATSNNRYNSNVYNIGGDWELMEASGAVFLPAAGYRYVSYSGAYTYNFYLQQMNRRGYYWSSTVFDNGEDIVSVGYWDRYYAKWLFFGTEGNGTSTSGSNSWNSSEKQYKFHGCSVRLVKNAI